MEAGSLQSILATLAQLGQSTSPDIPSNTTFAVPESQHINAFSAPPFNGSTTPPGEPPAGATGLLPTRYPQDPRLGPQSRSGTATPKPMIDPASITQWQEGLRCVTKIAAQNAHFASCIQKMMHDQKTNEMRWYTERQNLKQIQSNRSASAANAQKILSSLPALCAGPVNGGSHVEIDKGTELAEFDRKIYAAQQAMDVSMTAEMKRLGVPFFQTDANLVVEDGRDLSREPLPDGHPKFSPLVTETQLLQMRRKMVAHLEDLYRDR